MTIAAVAIFGALILGLVANRLWQPRIAAYNKEIGVGSQAAVVDNIFETAAYLPEPYKRRLQRAAVCYARGVAGPEWQSMGKGSIERSPVPSNWTGSGHNGIRKNFQEMRPGAPLFTNLLAADQKRGDSPRDRLAQAAPKIPGIVFAFLLAGIALGTDDAEDFIDEYGKRRMRCDADGNPTGSLS